MDPARDTPTPDTVAVERMRVRVRALRALRGAIATLLPGLAYATATLVIAKLGLLPDPRARVALALSALFPLAGALMGALRSVSPLEAARLLDRHHGLDDRLSNALQFRALPEAERTPFTEAAVADAVDRARETPLDPKGALPWRWPDETRLVGLSLAVLALAAAVEFPDHRVIRAATSTAPQGPRDPVALTDDDLQAMREAMEQIERQARTDASRRAVSELNRLLDDIAASRIDRQEGFRRLADLQRAVDLEREVEGDATQRALQQMGRPMSEQSALTRDLARAMQRGDAAAAREAMRALAQQLREHPPTPAQRQQLQQQLQRAAEAQPQEDREALQRQLEQARREMEQLLRQQRERQLSRPEEELLRRRRREAEHLQRRQERNEAQRREAEHLQRELQQAAQDLARSMQDALRDLERGAEQLSRMDSEQQGQRSLEEMRRQLEQLREMLRQQNGQNGQQMRQRLARFQRNAGGQPGSHGQSGQQGQGQPGQGGQPGQAGQAGEGAQGQGSQQGNGTPQGVTLGRGGEGIPLPVPGQSGAGENGDREGGNDSASGAGAQHEENARGAAADLLGRTRAVQVQGQQTGNGPSRSQVIRSAASQGFANAPYRTVYQPYWEHAREVLHQGEVPPGYRGYVRRYFQLIRPREE